MTRPAARTRTECGPCGPDPESFRGFHERVFGGAAEQAGARPSGDPDVLREVEERLRSTRNWNAGATEASRRLGIWPFAAPWRDWSPDEVARFGRLID